MFLRYHIANQSDSSFVSQTIRLLLSPIIFQGRSLFDLEDLLNKLLMTISSAILFFMLLGSIRNVDAFVLLFI